MNSIVVLTDTSVVYNRIAERAVYFQGEDFDQYESPSDAFTLRRRGKG
jgi:hypothetical protein